MKEKKWRPTHKSLLSKNIFKRIQKREERKRTFGVSHATGSKVLKDDDEGAQKKEVGEEISKRRKGQTKKKKEEATTTVREKEEGFT